MLGRLLRTRLRAAEAALTAGRLDEAFRLATAPDLVEEHQAKQVLAKAGEQLFMRAEAHFKAGRCAEALQDLDKAEHAGVKVERVQDLRTIVQAAAEEELRNQHSRRERIEAAQDRLAAGSLRAAGQILERASKSDVNAHKLKQRAVDREKKAQELFEEVKQYVHDNHLSTAIERFKEARQLHPKNKKAAGLEKVLVEKIVASVQQSLKEGRINRAFEEINFLAGIGDGRPEKKEILSVLDCLAAAGSAVESSNYEEARRKVLVMERLLPGVKWVKQASEQLKQIDELTTQLHGGPLDMVPMHDPGSRKVGLGDQRGMKPNLAETIATPQPKLLGDSLFPERLLILVDGSGSYLLIRNSRASIGRAASDQPADIPLVSDLSQRHADIARVDDDYFLFANREVNVGGQNIRQKLLQNGDKIILGKRAKLTFNLPSRKSASAVLDLGESAKMPNAVRRVILFDRLVTIGRHPSSHIFVTTAGEELVLYERSGVLWLRHQANGRQDPGIQVELDKTIELAGVSMVFEPWKV